MLIVELVVNPLIDSKKYFCIFLELFFFPLKVVCLLTGLMS